MNIKELALRWFAENPAERDQVMKAYYAYHTGHPRTEVLRVHYFSDSIKKSRCFWCGRTREQVRWDALPAECEKHQTMLNIKEVILREEQLFHNTREKALDIIPKIIKKQGLSGETLAYLYYTHGADPELVSSIVDIPSTMITEYYNVMEQEKQRERKAFQPVVIMLQE